MTDTELLQMSDSKMLGMGYRYRCDPEDRSTSPYVSLYAKTMEMVGLIFKDWPKQRFSVVTLPHPDEQLPTDPWEMPLTRPLTVSEHLGEDVNGYVI
jgi:hypothetical protein